MADTTYVDEITVIEADWLNEINDFYHTTMNGQTTAAGVRTALGLGALATLASVDASTIDAGAVDTSELADNGVTLAKLEHGTEGDVLYYGASGAPLRLAKGSDAEVLTLASGLPSWSATGLIVAQVVKSLDSSVATGTTTMPSDDVAPPQNTEGDQYMSLAITPTSATNRLLIMHVGMYSSTAFTSAQQVALFQDSTANALSASIFSGVAGGIAMVPLFHDMVAGTTNATTFKIRSGNTSAGTTTFNGISSGRLMGGVASSALLIMEYVP